MHAPLLIYGLQSHLSRGQIFQPDLLEMEIESNYNMYVTLWTYLPRGTMRLFRTCQEKASQVFFNSRGPRTEQCTGCICDLSDF